MNVFTPVFFNAPLGDLQRHVFTQVRALLRSRHSVTVMCKPGEFADSLRGVGAAVIETDFADIQGATEAALAGAPYELVHTHPFAARRVGIEVARRLAVPFVLQMHGYYTDHIGSYHDDVDLLVVDSENDDVRRFRQGVGKDDGCGFRDQWHVVRFESGRAMR